MHESFFFYQNIPEFDSNSSETIRRLTLLSFSRLRISWKSSRSSSLSFRASNGGPKTLRCPPFIFSIQIRPRKKRGREGTRQKARKWEGRIYEYKREKCHMGPILPATPRFKIQTLKVSRDGKTFSQPTYGIFRLICMFVMSLVLVLPPHAPTIWVYCLYTWQIGYKWLEPGLGP